MLVKHQNIFFAMQPEKLLQKYTHQHKIKPTKDNNRRIARTPQTTKTTNREIIFTFTRLKAFKRNKTEHGKL